MEKSQATPISWWFRIMHAAKHWRLGNTRERGGGVSSHVFHPFSADGATSSTIPSPHNSSSPLPSSSSPAAMPPRRAFPVWALSSFLLYQPSEAGFRLELVYKTREIFMAACRMDSELDIFDYLESKIPDASGLNWVPGLLERFPDPLPSLFNPHILFAHHPRLAPG